MRISWKRCVWIRSFSSNSKTETTLFKETKSYSSDTRHNNSEIADQVKNTLLEHRVRHPEMEQLK